MNRNLFRAAVSAGLAASLLSSLAWADGADPKETDPISDYLADLSPGPVAANDMIGVSASAVTTLSAPKDFTAALEGLTSGDNSAAFGVAVTPGRTRYAPVSIASYRANWYSRLLAGTTLSYAQNTLTQSGTDYHQQALALHVSFYLDGKDDAAIAAYDAFTKCTPLRDEVTAEAVRVAAGTATRSADDEKAFLADLDKKHDACLSAVPAATQAQWNASQFGLMVGESWIRGPGGPKLTLGKSASVALAYGAGDGLLNLTVRRSADSLDVTTIASGPVRSSSTLAGLRYTYKPPTTAGVLALAEVSNAKGSSGGQPNSVYKSALGVDYRLRDGVWLQFRVGRNHTDNGSSLQTATLFGIRMSPKSTLPVD